MKTFRFMLLLSLSVAVATFNATAQTKPAMNKETEMAAATTQIEAALRGMEEAFKRNNMAGVARFYADDGTMFYPNNKKAHGRAAIDEYWAKVKEPKDWKLQVVEFGGDAETIYQVGKSTLISGGGNKPNTSVCDFVLIWKKQPDSTYKIHVDINN